MNSIPPNLHEIKARMSAWLGSCEWMEALKRNGRNNRVYEVESRGARFFCKQYFRGKGELLSSRQDAEWRFSKLANQVSPGKSPKALYRDDTLAVSLFEYIDGKALALPIKEEDAVDAFRFLSEINQEEQPTDAFPLASDSCFSMEQHLKHVERRLDCFERSGNEALLAFVSGRLRPVYVAASDVVKQLRWDEGTILEQVERILSPSDFGFHNALKRQNGENVYLDFEYAGWDDPVKCVCDFFSQPDFPVPIAAIDGVIGELPRKCRRRVEILVFSLLPLYIVKWTCIMLNPFVREVGERRQFSIGEGVNLENVLLAAKAYFEQHSARRLKSWPT